MNVLTSAEIEALKTALDDEYRAYATYDQIIADFGEVRPFSNIRDAEARHIAALCGLFTRYGLTVPENPWPGKVERYNSLNDACEAGVAAEIANSEIYDRLMQATQRPDILTVFGNLRDASQQNHLPAFRRCAQVSAASGENGAVHRGRRSRHRGGRV